MTAGYFAVNIFDYIATTPLTTYRIYAKRHAASLIEGVLRRHPEGGARRGVLRRAACNRSPREARDPARQALRPGCEELAARVRKANARRCRTAGAQGDGSAAPRRKNRHGGAPRGERPASWDARRLARRLAYRVMIRLTGAAAPERFSALRPPLDSG